MEAGHGHEGRGRSPAGWVRRGMNRSKMARKARASRVHSVMRAIGKVDVQAGLCSQTVMGSKEVVWLLDTGTGTEDFRMEKKCRQHQALGAFVMVGGNGKQCGSKTWGIGLGGEGGLPPGSPQPIPWLRGSSQSPFSCQSRQLCPEAFLVHCSKAQPFLNLIPQPVPPKEKEVKS